MKATDNKNNAGTGKYISFIFETTANPSLIQLDIGTKTQTTNPRTMKIPNGPFRPVR